MAPGLKASEVMGFVGKCYADAGYDWNFKIGRCGHGIGLELAEQPSLDANSDVVLKPGMTLAFEPAILDECGLFDMEEDFEATVFALKTRVDMPTELQQWIDKNFDFADLKQFAPWLPPARCATWV